MKCTVVLLAIFVFKVESFQEAPQLQNLTALDPPGFEITWIPTEKLDGNPVEGYKLHVWELPDEDIEQWVKINGTLEKRVVKKPAKVGGKDHRKDPLVINIPGAKSDKTIVRPILLHVQYEMRIQAYSKEAEGPMSSTLGIKIGD